MFYFKILKHKFIIKFYLSRQLSCTKHLFLSFAHSKLAHRISANQKLCDINNTHSKIPLKSFDFAHTHAHKESIRNR